MAGSATIGRLRADPGLNTAAFQQGLTGTQKSMAPHREADAERHLAMASTMGGVPTAIRGAINDADAMAKASAKFGLPVEQSSRLVIPVERIYFVCLGIAQDRMRILSPADEADFRVTR